MKLKLCNLFLCLSLSAGLLLVGKKLLRRLKVRNFEFFRLNNSDMLSKCPPQNLTSSACKGDSGGPITLEVSIPITLAFNIHTNTGLLTFQSHYQSIYLSTLIKQVSIPIILVVIIPIKLVSISYLLSIYLSLLIQQVSIPFILVVNIT